MPEIKSIKQALLNDTAAFVAEDISYAVINGTIKIPELSKRQVSENVISIEYPVNNDMTSVITDIKLMNSKDEILMQTAVYVPVTQTILSKHIITVKEGV